MEVVLAAFQYLQAALKVELHDIILEYSCPHTKLNHFDHVQWGSVTLELVHLLKVLRDAVLKLVDPQEINDLVNFFKISHTGGLQFPSIDSAQDADDKLLIEMGKIDLGGI